MNPNLKTNLNFVCVKNIGMMVFQNVLITVPIFIHTQLISH